MTAFDGESLMRLLPAVHRLRDVDGLPVPEQNQLRALLAVIEEQVAILREDLAQLYDDQFIDTCADWVIPYIGDLLGTTALYTGSPDEGRSARSLMPELNGPRFAPVVGLRGRPDVAKTIYYRKRTATVPMLEELASDVTGWAAHVVEFFEILRWTQCIRNHLRMHAMATPDVRRYDMLERLHGPFDAIGHTVDIAPISQFEGWHETRNVGFFIWRLRSYRLQDIRARSVGAAGDFRFQSNPLGLDAPLFSALRRSDEGGLTEPHVPAAIRPRLLVEDLARHASLVPEPDATSLYGERESLSIRIGGTFITPKHICSAVLDPWPATAPAGTIVAVDVRNGRIAVGDGFTPDDVEISYHYGFPADLGGGTYSRTSWLVKRAGLLVIHVPAEQATLADALDAWRAAGSPNAVIELAGDATYDETAALTIDPPAGRGLTIEAVDRRRPHVRLAQPLAIAPSAESTVTLSGLLVEGSVEVTNAAGRVRIIHTTLVPQAPSITVSGSIDRDDPLRLEIAFSIVGAIRAPRDIRGLWLLDSIVDGLITEAITDPAGLYGPAAWIERSTLFGVVRVREVPLATEVIFTEPLLSERKQIGCVRFSYVPRDSRTPRRYRCQPDLEIALAVAAEEKEKGAELTPVEREEAARLVAARVQPAFTSDDYGEPAYAQLHVAVPRQIAAGAEDGSEMGAYCHLKQPQREQNLRSRLGTHLPFGLQAGIIYVT
ncbi:MAG: hypothetical protein ACXW5U_05115 [Thermoanaerobaculia bacterium]